MTQKTKKIGFMYFGYAKNMRYKNVRFFAGISDGVIGHLFAVHFARQFPPPDGGITFATNLVNGIKQPDGTIKSLTPRQVGDLLGHSTSQITEMYYVKRDNLRLVGITDNFEFQTENSPYHLCTGP